jgi:hypothetical protein
LKFISQGNHLEFQQSENRICAAGNEKFAGELYKQDKTRNTDNPRPKARFSVLRLYNTSTQGRQPAFDCDIVRHRQ